MRKRNISPERLIEAIKEYIDRKGSFDTIAEKYGISYETIRSGFIRYKENGISTFIETKHNAVYTEELKTKAVIEYLQGKGSQTAIAAKYGLRSKSQLQRWIKAYNSGRGYRYSFSFSPLAYRVAFFFCSSCIGACTRRYGAAETPVSIAASCLQYVHIVHGSSFRKSPGSYVEEQHITDPLEIPDEVLDISSVSTEIFQLFSFLGSPVKFCPFDRLKVL